MSGNNTTVANNGANNATTTTTTATTEVKGNASLVTRIARFLRKEYSLTGKLPKGENCPKVSLKSSLTETGYISTDADVLSLTNLLAEDFVGIVETDTFEAVQSIVAKLSDEEKKSVQLLIDTSRATLELLMLSTVVGQQAQGKKSSSAKVRHHTEDAKHDHMLRVLESFAHATKK